MRVVMDVNPLIPCGVIVTTKSNLETIVEATRKARVLKHRVNVTQFAGDASGSTLPQDAQVAVHIVASEPLPDKLAEAIKSCGASFVPGVRLYSPPCLQPRPRVCTTRKSATRALFTFVELFSGMGGFRWGLEPVGGKCVFASDISAPARAIYQANFGDEPTGDITEIPASAIPPHDLLTAGFPCQSFCKAGDQKGLEDSRGALFFEVVRILRCCQPKAFLLENVENLLRLENGDVLKRVLEELEACGYTVKYQVIDSAVVVPQTRLRVYFVAFRNDLANEAFQRFAWPRFSDVDRPKLCDVLEKAPPPATILTPSQLDHVRKTDSFLKSPRWRVANLNGTARTLMGSYRSSYLYYSEFVPLAESCREEDLATAPLRFYSLRECASLQGFPQETVLKAPKLAENTVYRLIGNAVCPLVIKRIAEKILDGLAPPMAAPMDSP